jgi:hypothetical protein
VQAHEWQCFDYLQVTACNANIYVHQKARTSKRLERLMSSGALSDGIVDAARQGGGRSHKINKLSFSR